MAITQNPITGTMRKTAGGMVFSRSLDQNVMRAKPITYNDRKSDAQVKQRVRMKACHGLSKADSKKALDAAFPTRPTKQTKFSAFVQALIKVVTGGLTGVTYDWTKLLSFGNGTLPSPFADLHFVKEVNNMDVHYLPAAGATSAQLDLTIFVFLFNTTKGAGYSLVTTKKVSDGTATISYPSNWVQLDTIKAFVGAMDTAAYNSTPAIQIA